MNAIAVFVMGLGAALFLSGLFLLIKRKRLSGIVISVLGLGAVAAPFLVSLFLATAGP